MTLNKFKNAKKSHLAQKSYGSTFCDMSHHTSSLNDLQSMLNVCDNVSSQLLLKFKTNKCKCIAFGKMTNRAMSGDGLRLDNGVVMWFDTTEYLGIHFRCGKRLQVDIDPIRRRFYAASNSMFMNASHQDQLIQPSSVGICSCFY